MSTETAAAILTKLAFEQNTKLKSRLSKAQGQEKELASVMLPLFRQIFAEMGGDLRSHNKFTPAVPDRSRRGARNRPQSHPRRVTKGHDRSDEREIGGEG